MNRIIEVVTTGDDREVMEEIGKKVVEQRLASCAQVSGPIKSVYWWKGRIEETTEWVCTFKSRYSLYGLVEQAIRELHPYETPEIICREILQALPEYSHWVTIETKADCEGEAP